MRKGRKPKPTKLKLVADNPGKRELNEDEPEPAELEFSEPPAHLSPEAAAKWYGTGEYKNVEVESISGSGSGVEVEVYDHDTGEYRTLEME